MHEQRKAILELLQNDEELLKLLASNKAFWNENLEEEARYSILPVDKIYDGIKTPFLTVQLGGENQVGTTLLDAFAYIRCYNEEDKTFVNIDAVLSRVKVLLHKHRFAQYADNAVSIDTVYETTGPEARDEAYRLNYRESRYRLTYL